MPPLKGNRHYTFKFSKGMIPDADGQAAYRDTILQRLKVLQVEAVGARDAAVAADPKFTSAEQQSAASEILTQFDLLDAIKSDYVTPARARGGQPQFQANLAGIRAQAAPGAEFNKLFNYMKTDMPAVFRSVESTEGRALLDKIFLPHGVEVFSRGISKRGDLDLEKLSENKGEGDRSTFSAAVDSIAARYLRTARSFEQLRILFAYPGVAAAAATHGVNAAATVGDADLLRADALYFASLAERAGQSLPQSSPSWLP